MCVNVAVERFNERGNGVSVISFLLFGKVSVLVYKRIAHIMT